MDHVRYGIIFNGLILANEGGLYGYVDYTGKYIIKSQFIKANTFSDSVAVVLRKEDFDDRTKEYTTTYGIT